MNQKNKCPLCGSEFDGEGEDASPLAEGKCCRKCFKKKVVPAQLAKCDQLPFVVGRFSR